MNGWGEDEEMKKATFGSFSKAPSQQPKSKASTKNAPRFSTIKHEDGNVIASTLSKNPNFKQN